MFAALAAAAMLVGPARSIAGVTRSPLPWRVGGRVAFTVDAAAFPDSSGHTVDVYLRLSPTTLTGLARDSDGTGRLAVTAEFKSGRGNRQHLDQEVEIAPSDSAGGWGKVVLLRFQAKAGVQRLKVHVEDTQSRKKGLVYSGHSAHESAEIEGEFTVPATQQGRDLSDPEFVWNARPGGEPSPFHRGASTLVPNPERIYGLFAPEFQVAFFARASEPRPWHWRVSILDGEGKRVASRDSSTESSVRLDVRYEYDVAKVPAGGYDCQIEAWQDGDAHPLTRRARFSVAWLAESWQRNPVETEDLVHLLLGGRDEEEFVAMHPGEQERWLDDFWRRRDPSPGTPQNEVRDAFLARVAAADQRFSRFGLSRGMFTDMGRVFVRYGEPSEILRQVMPAGDETLLQMLQQLALEEDRPLGGIRQRGPGGDIRPFEVWIYEGDIPTPPDADPTTQRGVRHQRLVFLFVDEHGLGDYRMRYSNE